MLSIAILTNGFHGLVARLLGSLRRHHIHSKKSHHRQRFYYTEHRLFEQSLDVYYPTRRNTGDTSSAPPAAVVCLVVGSAWLGHSRLIYGPTSWWNSSGPRSVATVDVSANDGGDGVVCVCIRHRGGFPKFGEYVRKWNWNWIVLAVLAVLAAVIWEAFVRDFAREPENDNENESRPHVQISIQHFIAISASIAAVATFLFSLLLLEKIVTRGGNNRPATFDEMQHDVMTALAWCHKHRDRILLLDNSPTRPRPPPILFGGYSSGGHVAATLLQRPASFWTETHRLPPPERFFAAALYISPVLATRSIREFCREEGVWDLLWKSHMTMEEPTPGRGRGERLWRRKHSSSSTAESSVSDSGDSAHSTTASVASSSSLSPSSLSPSSLTSKSAIPLSTETSHSTATTSSSSSSSSSSSPSSSSSLSLEEQQQQQHCSDEQSSHDKRMESSQQKQQNKQQQLRLQTQLQKQLSPPTWLTDQILQLVFGTTQTNNDNHIDNHNKNNHQRNHNHHRPPHHPPSPLHDYRKTPHLPHIFIGCQREVPLGISWLDSFFVSRIYSVLLREKLFWERDPAVVVHEYEPNDGLATGTGTGEHRFVVDSRYCEISSTDHWNILHSRELFRVLEREIGRVVRESAIRDSGKSERERERKE